MDKGGFIELRGGIAWDLLTETVKYLSISTHNRKNNTCGFLIPFYIQKILNIFPDAFGIDVVLFIVGRL